MTRARTLKFELLSLFDYSGAWSKPYRDAGWTVYQIDIKHGYDVNDTWWNNLVNVQGILAAPPCTDFSVSGAQYWKQKDLDGRTQASLALIYRTLQLVAIHAPQFWCLENPVGRLNRLVPELVQYGPRYFQPYQFGDPWTKKTGLWGEFNWPKESPVDPIRYTKQGSWTQKLGGKSERTKELRSITPAGFAAAFYKANSLEE